MKNQLDFGFHFRHTNRKVKEITNQTRREVRGEILPSKSHKAHLQMLMSVINTLPEIDRAGYTTIKSLVDDDTPRPKENSPAVRNVLTNKNTFNSPSSQKISEIPFKQYVDEDEYLYKIYISDVHTANDLVELKKYRIHAVLTFGTYNDPSKYTTLKGGYLCLPLEDASDLMATMEMVNKFINTHLNKGNLLIHCFEGNSKSCAALIGYLIKKCRITFEKALEVVRAGRPSVKIGYSFERQLRRIERKELYN